MPIPRYTARQKWSKRQPDRDGTVQHCPRCDGTRIMPQHRGRRWVCIDCHTVVEERGEQ